MKKSKLFILLAAVFAVVIAPCFTAAKVSAAEPKIIVVDNCDTGLGWNAVADDTILKEGYGAIYQRSSTIMLMLSIFNIDASPIPEAGAYIEFWLYVVDASKMVAADGKGQLELTDRGRRDDYNEIHWDVQTMSLKDGWNYVSLPFSSGVKTGSFNYEAINFLCLYQEGNSTQEFWLDNIIITDTRYVLKSSDEGIVEIPKTEAEIEITDAEKEAFRTQFVKDIAAANSTPGDIPLIIFFSIDMALVAGIGVMIFFIVRKKIKEKKAV